MGRIARWSERFTRYCVCCRQPTAKPHEDVRPQTAGSTGTLPTCVFEPRIDVLEKLVSELKTQVEQIARTQTTDSTERKDDMARMLQLLELLRVEHATVATTANPLQSRPTLVIPPPPTFARCGANDEGVPLSSPVDIPTATASSTTPPSPTWYPVSADSTAYHDAYSSEEDDRATDMGASHMVDA